MTDAAVKNIGNFGQSHKNSIHIKQSITEKAIVMLSKNILQLCVETRAGRYDGIYCYHGKKNSRIC